MSCFALEKIARQKSKQAAFHLEPVLPPSGEGSSQHLKVACLV